MPAVQEIQDIPSMEARVIKTLSRMDQDLPTIPVVLSQIMHLTASDDTSVPDLTRVLNQDQALTTRILRVANSAFYGLRDKVTTIDRAVIILGFDMVRSLAVGASFIHYFSTTNRCEGFELNSFWAHTIAVGVFSEILARKWGSIDPGDAFTAGILHDIGKLVMLIYFEDEFKQVLKRAAEDKLDFFDAEMMELGVSHAFVASLLLRHWNIPEILVIAIENHHQLLLPENELQLAACLNFADFAARYMQIGNSGSSFFNPPSLDLLKRTGFTVTDFKATLVDMKERRNDVFELISALD